MWLWLKQKSPDLVPIMTLVHDPQRGIYPAIRWVRPDEPLPEPKGRETQWIHLIEALHDYASRIYKKSTHRLDGDAEVLPILIEIADALPKGHPLREKVTRLALLHGCLVRRKTKWQPEVRTWFENTLKEMGGELPPPPEPNPKFKSFQPEPILLPFDEVQTLVEKQWEELKKKWHAWAKKRYGSNDDEVIKDGIVSTLTDKLMADKEFVEAFINSPLSFLFATTDDALRSEETLRERIYGFVDGLVGVWAQTASDHHPLAWALQIAVAQEFGLTEGYEALMERLREMRGSSSLIKQTAFLYNTLKPLLHKYVRAVYEETQEFLKETGLEELYLMRGVGLPSSAKQTLSYDEFKLFSAPFNPASSWSLNYRTAHFFAGHMAYKYGLTPVLYAIRLPKEAFHYIISTALTGWGCFSEEEIVLAFPKKQKVGAALAPIFV
jgi:hypothetical protein